MLADALRDGESERTAQRLVSQTLGEAGARAIGRRFELALVWLAAGALLGAALPALGLAVIVAFNAYYWLPIRGESPGPPA